jgi:hypothetical protein
MSQKIHRGWTGSRSWSQLTQKEQQIFFQLALALPVGQWEKVHYSKLPNGDWIGVIYAEPKFCLNLAFTILLGIPKTFVPGRVGKEFVAFGDALLVGDTDKALDSYLQAKRKMAK